MQTRKMASAFLQENDNNNKKKSTEQESDASMYKLLMVEKKKMFEMEECWFTMSPVSDAKVGRENRMWRRSSVISYVHSK